MAYDEQSFLNGLAAGLSVTGGQFLGALRRQLTAGTTRVGDYQWPEGNFDTFVFKHRFKEGFTDDSVLQTIGNVQVIDANGNITFNAQFPVVWQRTWGTHRRSFTTIEYEYGTPGNAQKEFCRVQSQTGGETVYHVIQIPEAAPMPDFVCNSYFYEPEGVYTAFDSYFMAFPYLSRGREYLYPGSPEEVQVWIVRSFRGFDL